MSATINRQIFVLSVFFVEANVQSQPRRIRCHPQGICSGCSTLTIAWTWRVLQVKKAADSANHSHAAAVVSPRQTWDGKRILDLSAKHNRKYDVGTSQLSRSPTLNTVSQSGEGIPESNTQWKELHLILCFLPFLRQSGIPLKSGKKIRVLYRRSGQ